MIHRISIVKQQSIGPGDRGRNKTQEQVIWSSLPCDIKTLSGNDTVLANQLANITSYEFTLNYYPNIDTTCRVRYNGKDFDITSIDNVGQRNRTLRIVCEVKE